MTTVATKFGLAKEIRVFKSHPKLHTNVSVGLEVELENLLPSHLNAQLDYWQIGEDGSLRPRNTSAELRFSLPFFGADAVAALDEFDKWINKPKFKLDLSDRCSLHCHVDVRDLHIEQVENFWAAALLVEGALFSYGGPERSQSVFCLPLSQRAIAGNVRGHEHFLEYLQHTQKYVAINPNNIGKIGTIEFRMHGSCANVERMTEWINILTCLREGSKNLSGEDMLALARRDREQCARILFGPMADVMLPHMNFLWQQSLSYATSFIHREILSKHLGYNLVLRKAASKEEE